MKPRPTIFLSGVSSEFASFRDAVEIEIQKKGCFVENQSSFATDYRTIEAMLRQKLTEADAVIHIVGFRYGAVPQQRPADKPRRSYTQMEFDIAREMEKPVYVFLAADATIRDPPKAEENPEDPETSALQLAHRADVQSTDHLYYTFKDKDDLCRLAATIQPVASVDFRADISRVDRYAPAELIGRDDELALLNDAWRKVRRAETARSHVVTFVALGGEGKTSLVAKWVADLAHDGWPGCDAAFAWSFYSQGTREQFTSSSDLFLKEAITFFGDEADKEFAASAAGAYEKGQHLARIVGGVHSLLILDGLEPLQYAPTSPTAGELKDHGIVALLKGLAASSKGLCIVTTRYWLPNLNAFRQTTAPEVKLERLSRDAGMSLLKLLGVKATSNELGTLVEDVKGHALTLNLLGTYLRDAHAGDIRRRDLVRLEEADAEEQSGHAFRVMEAYEQVFEAEDEKGKRALTILRLLGLFDRPMPSDCLEALLEDNGVAALTEPLVGATDAQRNLALKRLDDARLVTVNRDGSGALISVDAHPLLREYFALQLRKNQLESWREAHGRLFEHLRSTTRDKPQPTLEDLQPLYQAVAHGCQAGLYEEACVEVYRDRIQRGIANYSMRKLGAFGSDLGAMRWFYDTPWSRISPLLSDAAKSWTLSMTSFALHGVGRLVEAIQPLRAAIALLVEIEHWWNAAVSASNLSDLILTLGPLDDGLEPAKLSIIYADKTTESFLMMASRTVHADLLHQLGQFDVAEQTFRKAEQIQAKSDPDFPLLYSFHGVRYCDLLLGTAERVSWQRTLSLNEWSILPTVSTELSDIVQRATHSLESAATGGYGSLFETALDYLTLARTTFYITVQNTKTLPLKSDDALSSMLEAVLVQLRGGGRQDLIPRGLLLLAWYRLLTSYPEDARNDLDEAWEIAQRGPMRLHMADIHLYRARLFFRSTPYPWDSAQTDLEEAAKLINECGYHRRDEELADAKRAILGSS